MADQRLPERGELTELPADDWTCQFCSSSFSPKYKWRTPKYCSLECAYKDRKNKRKGKYISCLICGKKSYARPSQARKKKYCSRSCLVKSPERNNIISKKLRAGYANKSIGCGFKKGHIPWHKDKSNVFSKETRMVWSENRMGEKNGNWKGGISFEPYPVGWKECLRNAIRERDGYVCQECGIKQGDYIRKLDIHHIDYNKENLNPDNLISLCGKCHSTTNGRREYWERYFNNLLNKKLCQTKD